jgi:hypothetical protein
VLHQYLDLLTDYHNLHVQQMLSKRLASHLVQHNLLAEADAIQDALIMGRARRQQAYHGYHGYKWLSQPSLLLYVFPLLDDTLTELSHPAGSTSPQQLAESIEAELVYGIRHASGQWPLSHHEIHFHALPQHPMLRQLASNVADAIFQLLPRLQPTSDHP